MKKKVILLFLTLSGVIACSWETGPGDSSGIVDHNCTDITMIPQSTIQDIRDNLVIAYWHTSHGSQITTGMDRLDAFMGGSGLYIYNNTGSDGALKLMEPASTDIGKHSIEDWEQINRTFLDDPAHADVNVIMWAWCGQVSGATEEYIDDYLLTMDLLEADYPGVKFVYMTGHADGTGLEGNLHARNTQIRDYCEAEGKYLFDFYDIECYDPDGSYFGDRYVDDGCNYNGGNWAVEWQESHPGEWYECDSVHSEPLNANLKAYAAWWLFSVLL